MKSFLNFGLLIGVGLVSAVHAEEWPFQLVCFEEAGITASLNKVVNAQQFLRNDGILQSGSCGFAQIPAGSTARYMGVHASPHRFLFPVYREPTRRQGSGCTQLMVFSTRTSGICAVSAVQRCVF